MSRRFFVLVIIGWTLSFDPCWAKEWSEMSQTEQTNFILAGMRQGVDVGGLFIRTDNDDFWRSKKIKLIRGGEA